MTTVARRTEQDDSGEYSDASQDNDVHHTGADSAPPESDYDSRGSVSDLSEEEQENQETERRVDDDEDRSNPQYIPKRGTFYEHDDRTADNGEEVSKPSAESSADSKEPAADAPAERRRAPRKSDVCDKWSHDKFNENEQMPKTREELVAIYGYDIRNEEAPPHARRNRRYGRGPGKYTRAWEDEEAYKRQATAAAQSRKPPNPEDFPELDARASKKRPPRPRSKSQPTSNESLSGRAPSLRRNASTKSPRGPRSARAVHRGREPVREPAGEGRDDLPPLEKLTITTSVVNSGGPQRKVNATVAQQRPVPTAQAQRRPPAAQPQQQVNSVATKSPPQLSPAQQPKQQQQPQTALQQQTQQQPSVPTEGRGGSKRYSSLRQRPLAEPYTPQPQPQQQLQLQQQPQQQPQQQAPPQQPQTRYAEYPGAPPAQSSPAAQMHPQMMHQVHRSPAASQAPHGPSPPHAAMPPPPQPVRLGMMEQQQLVSHPHHQIHNMPQPHSMGQLPPAQGYAPPAMMPAQYMQQSATPPVFPGAPMYSQPPPAPYPHQLYQHQHHNYAILLASSENAAYNINETPPPLTQLPKPATQAGGVTYYNPTEQEPAGAPRTTRRPTAAIPIVRPNQPDRPTNPTEKDNIDRIVENMFVRKPWPGTGGSAESKDKASSEPRSSQEPPSLQEPPSKDSSQPNSLTSSSISNDSRPSADRMESKERLEQTKPEEEITRRASEPESLATELKEAATEESIATDA